MEQNQFKTIDVRALGKADILPLITILPQLRDEWDKEEDFELNKNKKASLSQVEHINFRWSDKTAEPVVYTDLPLWGKYKSLLLPILKKAVEPIGYKNGYFPRVMLANMLPGSVIPDHTDGSTRGWIAHKIHIPLITNNKALFFVKGVTYQFVAGDIYEVNNGAMHGACNYGNTKRIHLIFEYLNADINQVPGIDVYTA